MAYFVEELKAWEVGREAYAACEWFDWLLVEVQDHVWETSFECFVNTLPPVQGRTLPSSILALMEWWMDTTHTFHLPFIEIIITPMDFTVITGLPFKGRFIVFDDQLSTLDRLGLRASLKATISMEPTTLMKEFIMRASTCITRRCR
ncbi:hypothetical protein JCGZ_16694 [Jatropha curcas]|uniref:Aminotransferase-like plant mobile domain-containing protein n=1 Tax=Jatropha curcas TaxID=180498 RepID=A0A067K2R7_JATCU|nr:hypothetical protein JCGZ_16694 [Jatropha curcas]